MRRVAQNILLGVIVLGFFLIAPLVPGRASPAGQASGVPSEAGEPARPSHSQAAGGLRLFVGAALLSTPELEAAEPFITENNLVLTLPPAGEGGVAIGEFTIVLDIPGPVLYVSIAGLGAAVGEAIGESVSAATGATLDQVERSGIDVPPEYDDCVFSSSISGPLDGNGNETFAGEGTVTTVITGAGCEDTEVALGPEGQTTVVPSTWTATVEGDRMSGSIDLFDDDGDVSTILFEARETVAEFGVIERDGKLFLVSPPGGQLSISRSDLPEWARDQLVTVGAVIPVTGPPDQVITGDPNILLDGRPVARLDDHTRFGGVIVEGSETIFVNGVAAAFPGAFAVVPMVSGGGVPFVGGPVNPDCNLEEAAGQSQRALKNCLAEYDRVIEFLEQDAARGDTVLEVDSSRFEVGDGLLIGDDPDTVEAARVESKGSIVLDRPLSRDHPAGSPLVRVPDEQADLVPPPSDDEPATGTAPGEPADPADLASDGSSSPPAAGIAAIFAAVLVLGGGAIFVYWRRQA